MSQNMQGMDTEQGRQTGQNMGAQASAVTTMVSSISAMISGLKWQGNDRTTFESDWHGSFAPQATQAAQTLEDHGKRLIAHADAQDAVSS